MKNKLDKGPFEVTLSNPSSRKQNNPIDVLSDYDSEYQIRFTKKCSKEPKGPTITNVSPVCFPPTLTEQFLSAFYLRQKSTVTTSVDVHYRTRYPLRKLELRLLQNTHLYTSTRIPQKVGKTIHRGMEVVSNIRHSIKTQEGSKGPRLTNRRKRETLFNDEEVDENRRFRKSLQITYIMIYYRMFRQYISFA